MTLRARLSLAVTAVCLAAAGPGHAIGVNDALGDYVPGFAGSKAGDLDVLGAFVTYNASTDTFVFSGTMANDIGTTPGGFYVWGINRGLGTARFAGSGIGGVLFDTVLIVNADGSGSVNRLAGAGAGAANNIALAAGTAKNFGSTQIVSIAGSFLPSNGFAKADYTWNLWPRDGKLPNGFGQISDFAPDNSNLKVLRVGVVPEPTTWAMFAGGLALVALRRRRAQAGA